VTNINKFDSVFAGKLKITMLQLKYHSVGFYNWKINFAVKVFPFEWLALLGWKIAISWLAKSMQFFEMHVVSNTIKEHSQNTYAFRGRGGSAICYEQLKKKGICTVLRNEGPPLPRILWTLPYSIRFDMHFKKFRTFS
jgi:hypothetical protein